MTDVYYDPYDREIDADPYPVYARLREERPLYYNEEHDFYAVSRFEDVQRGLLDRQTFSSARGSVLEFIKANIEIPPGNFYLRGSTVARCSSRLALKSVHPEEDARPRGEGPRVLRKCSRSTCRRWSSRLRRRSRGADPDAHDRNASWCPRIRPRGSPRPRQCLAAHRSWETNGCISGQPRAGGFLLRLHRLASDPPLRRPDVGIAVRRIRRRARENAKAHPRRGSHVCECDLRRRQRDHESPHWLDGEGTCRTS